MKWSKKGCWENNELSCKYFFKKGNFVLDFYIFFPWMYDYKELGKKVGELLNYVKYLQKVL